MLDVPFANVVDPEFGAAGNGTGDDAPAFQAAVDYMYSHYGGGPICVPPGDFCFGGDAGIIMKGACRLVGSGRSLSVINALATDIDVVTFDSSCSAAGMTELGVYGYNNPRATKSAVTVAPNALVNLRNSNIWFGKNGLAHAGVDGIVDDCYIQGRQYGGSARGPTGTTAARSTRISRRKRPPRSRKSPRPPPFLRITCPSAICRARMSYLSTSTMAAISPR
jgi:hypothetical protein